MAQNPLKNRKSGQRVNFTQTEEEYMKSSYHKKIFESYLEESPTSVDRIDRWEKYGSNSVKIFYKDGTKAVYHKMMRTLRGIRKNNGSASDWQRDFRDELVERMYDCGYTQQTLSEKIGISQQTMSKYLNKESIPSGYVLSKMADALHCSMDDIGRFSNR